jgi:hypothetical protein
LTKPKGHGGAKKDNTAPKTTQPNTSQTNPKKEEKREKKVGRKPRSRLLAQAPWLCSSVRLRNGS